jgi:long-subunit fatty acid transport protein
MNKRVLAVTIGLAIAAGTAPAWANIGMENIAAGVIAEGHGGTAIAVGDDTSVMNTNPALLSNIENNRMDANMTMMFPEYSYKSATDETSGMKPIFVIPTMGLAWKQTDRMHLGVAFFNEGGSGTDYGPIYVNNTNSATYAGGNPPVLAEYYSMFGYMVVTPSLAYKATDNLSLGISAQPGYAMARMKMPFNMALLSGGNFGSIWQADMNMHDYNYRTKIGAVYTINPAMGVGFSYTTKTDINLRGTARMMAPGGTPATPRADMSGTAAADMGWPSSYKIGAYMDMRGMGMQRMSLDIERINWSEYYGSVPFKMTDLIYNGTAMVGAKMAMAMNLGWTDQTAYKLGFEQPFGDMVTMRMGWVHGRSMVPNGGILAIMNPIVEDHYTMGMGIYPNKSFEINMAMTYGVGHKQTNDSSNTIMGSFNGGTAVAVSSDMNGTTIGMKFYTMSMGIGYKW